jgi:hypothetical protein
MPSSTDAVYKYTRIEYYYALESSEIIGHAEVQELEEILFGMVSSRILWCTSETSPAINVTIPSTRKLALIQQYPESKFIGVEFSRMLRLYFSHPFVFSIVQLLVSQRITVRFRLKRPEDWTLFLSCRHHSIGLSKAVRTRKRAFVKTFALTCPNTTFCLFPTLVDCSYQFEANYCVVLQGRVKILAQQSDDVAIVVASILDASQELMENNMLLDDADTPKTVTKVQWLGETLEEAEAFGTDADDGDRGGVVDGGVVAGVQNEEEPNANNSSGITTIFAVAVPLLVLIGFAFLMTRIRRQRTVMTPVELETGDQDVLVGTGDPPRSFHTGLYHYTQSGSRYLSTNCYLCAETRMSGFSTDGNLPTITEGRIFGLNWTSSEGESYDDFSLDEAEDSVDPAMQLISPNSKNLGGIHSGIDVHQCTSATCNICRFRGDEVAFLPSPRLGGNSNRDEAWREEDDIICDNDDLGEVCVV